MLPFDICKRSSFWLIGLSPNTLPSSLVILCLSKMSDVSFPKFCKISKMIQKHLEMIYCSTLNNYQQVKFVIFSLEIFSETSRTPAFSTVVHPY